jgi:hypothetical protein
MRKLASSLVMGRLRHCSHATDAPSTFIHTQQHLVRDLHLASIHPWIRTKIIRG